MPTDHIMKSYDEELTRLNNAIIRMGGCRNKLCEDCKYCNKIASKAVIVREASRTPILNAQEALVREIESGDFWRL